MQRLYVVGRRRVPVVLVLNPAADATGRNSVRRCALGQLDPMDASPCALARRLRLTCIADTPLVQDHHAVGNVSDVRGDVRAEHN
jgi:hypothetical protein